MKVTLLLSEAATNHPDGTVSMLRAGIQRFWSAKEPAPLMGALVARIDAEPTEGGVQHKFLLRVLDEDGKDIMPKLEGQFTLPEGGGSINLVINFQVQFPRHGRYGFYVNIDGQLLDRWPLQVSPPAKPPHPENQV